MTYLFIREKKTPIECVIIIIEKFAYILLFISILSSVAVDMFELIGSGINGYWVLWAIINNSNIDDVLWYKCVSVYCARVWCVFRIKCAMVCCCCFFFGWYFHYFYVYHFPVHVTNHFSISRLHSAPLLYLYLILNITTKYEYEYSLVNIENGFESKNRTSEMFKRTQTHTIHIPNGNMFA